MKTLALCAAVLALAVPAASFAGEHHEKTSVAISMNGLDLSNGRDAQIMLNRIDRAAMEACGAYENSLRDLQNATRRGECYSDAMSRAVATLNAPNVTALYNQRPVTLASN